MNPYLVLLVLTALIAITFFPRFGLLAEIARRRKRLERQRREDALKHLLEVEGEGRAASVDTLGGALGLRPPAVERLISALKLNRLIEKRAVAVKLTRQGRQYALQVVRAHRLWERYLADEARMPLTRIHEEAHHREHGLTADQLEAMDAALGYPRRDPHGDPIPTRRGRIPRQSTSALTSWPLNKPGRVVHLEDEPAIALQQLVAAGIRLGQVVTVVERGRERIVLSDGETEYTLAPAVAANVNLQTVGNKPERHREAVPLSEVAEGMPAEVLWLDESVQGFTRRRFLDLGLTPGTMIVPELRTIFGDPRGYRVRGTLLALRHNQADSIWVKPRPARAADRGRRRMSS